MKKILFVTDERQMGGVSIVLEDILNNINLKNKQIDLLILHNNGDRLKNIPKNVNIIYGSKYFNTIDIPLKILIQKKQLLKITKKLYTSFLIKTNLIKYKIKKERKKILKEKYDTEIAFKYGFTSLFVIYGNSNKKINWVHCDPKTDDPALKYRKLFKKIIPNFDYNIVLSKKTKQNFQEIYPTSKTKIIKNIIPYDKIKKATKDVVYKENEQFKIITIGRLSKEKDHKKIIEVFNKLNNKKILKNTTLEIIGDGPLKQELEELINQYKLENNIKLLGKKDNPYIHLKQADLFVLSSISEGFGLVIIEAFLCGTPVLSVDVASAKELIEAKYGIISENNIEGLYKELKNILLNKETLKKIRKNLENYNYSNEKIIQEIEKIIE